MNSVILDTPHKLKGAGGKFASPTVYAAAVKGRPLTAAESRFE